jgi:hypothetical protein
MGRRLGSPHRAGQFSIKIGLDSWKSSPQFLLRRFQCKKETYPDPEIHKVGQFFYPEKRPGTPKSVSGDKPLAKGKGYVEPEQAFETGFGLWLLRGPGHLGVFPGFHLGVRFS